MKTLKTSLLAVACILCFNVLPAFALSDSEYRSMMKNPIFANADKALNTAWKSAKSNLSSYEFENLKKDQQRWIKSGREAEAKALMKQYSKVEAYARVTNSRAQYIMQFIQDNEDSYDIFINSIFQRANQISKGNPTEIETSYGRTWRVWRTRDYILVKQDNFVMNFWTSNPQISFANGLKVGSSLNDLQTFFSDDNIYYEGNRFQVIGGNRQWLNFTISNSRVASVEFYQAPDSTEDQMPARISQILDSYTN